MGFFNKLKKGITKFRKLQEKASTEFCYKCGKEIVKGEKYFVKTNKKAYRRAGK